MSKELVLSYKSIYKNTYDIIVVNLGKIKNNKDENNFVFRHESFHLWEQYIKGIHLSSNYFLTIS